MTIVSKSAAACRQQNSITSTTRQQDSRSSKNLPTVRSIMSSLSFQSADGKYSARPLSTTQPRRSEAMDITEIPPTPIFHLSEIESSMAEAVSKFATDVIGPKVREMDENEKMDPAIVEQLFEQGLMGIEIPEKYGGAGMNFTAAIVGIEELARVDPSVSVLVDVHNTLVNTAILKYGSTVLKEKFLPKLATNTVGKQANNPLPGTTL